MLLRRRSAIAGSLSLLATPSIVSAQASHRLFALIVGIDDYQFTDKLRGCVNDARLFERTVRPTAHRMTVLIDGQATRGAFLRTWDRMASEARPGDTILITFSGHGAQEAERMRGNEADGKDETIIFYGFHPRRQPNNAERVFDDELGERFRRSGQRGVRSIFLADSCHSGNLSRSVDGRAADFTYRSVGYQEIENDMLAALATVPAQVEGQPNLLLISAGQEHEKIPEIPIDGVRRGATSYAFCQAFQRGLTAGRFPSTQEFARQVIAGARSLADGRHHPLAENNLPEAEPLIPLGAPVASTAPPPVSVQSGLRPLRIHVLPGSGPLASSVGSLANVTMVADRAEADLIIDPARSDLISKAGDVIASSVRQSDLPSSVEKVAALEILQRIDLPPMDVGLVPRGGALAPGGANSNDQRHQVNAQFDLVVRPPWPAALIVCHMASDGTVSVMSPRSRAASLSTEEWRLGVRVTPPSGADHVIAIASTSPDAIRFDDLRQMHRQRVPIRLARALASGTGSRAIGLFGFFTQ